MSDFPEVSGALMPVGKVQELKHAYSNLEAIIEKRSNPHVAKPILDKVFDPHILGALEKQDPNDEVMEPRRTGPVYLQEEDYITIVAAVGVITGAIDNPYGAGTSSNGSNGELPPVLTNIIKLMNPKFRKPVEAGLKMVFLGTVQADDEELPLRIRQACEDEPLQAAIKIGSDTQDDGVDIKFLKEEAANVEEPVEEPPKMESGPIEPATKTADSEVDTKEIRQRIMDYLLTIANTQDGTIESGRELRRAKVWNEHSGDLLTGALMQKLGLDGSGQRVSFASVEQMLEAFDKRVKACDLIYTEYLGMDVVPVVKTSGRKASNAVLLHSSGRLTILAKGGWLTDPMGVSYPFPHSTGPGSFDTRRPLYPLIIPNGRYASEPQSYTTFVSGDKLFGKLFGTFPDGTRFRDDVIMPPVIRIYAGGDPKRIKEYDREVGFFAEPWNIANLSMPPIRHYGLKAR